MQVNQQARKRWVERVTFWTGVIDPAYQGKMGLLLCRDGQEEYIWIADNPLSHFLVFPCSELNSTIQFRQDF